MPQRVAVAVSGGVDSLAALVRLRDAGHEVLALHALLHDPVPPEPASQRPAPQDPVPGLRAACARLDVPLEIVDLRPAFAREVRQPFAQALADALTPNPCARCNPRIKFGALQDAAHALGCARFATGHYARLEQGPAGPWLARAADDTKDQGYFLALVPQDRLGHVIFPLAGHTKADNRAVVAAAGLEVPVPGESQDVCFLPPGDASGHDWLTLTGDASLPEPQAGPILLQEDAAPCGPDGAGGGAGAAVQQEGLRVVGRHRGLWRYTLGQRRGLGIAHSEGLYVLRKDIARNALVVGPRALLGSTGCVTGKANLFCPPEQWPDIVHARLRYRQQAVPARARLDAAGCLHISLAEPQYPTAPGQVAALYDAAGHLLAGALVAAVLP